MRVRLFTMLLAIVMVSTSALAQNNGQSPESKSMKIEFLGVTSDRKATIRLHNYQTVDVNILVEGNTTSTHAVKATSNTIIYVDIPSSGIVRAKPLNSGAGVDNGWVELRISLSVLPLKFVSFKTEALVNKKVKVTFEVAELVNVKQFNVQLSLDGSTWNNVALMFPDELQPNRVYSIIVDLSNRVGK